MADKELTGIAKLLYGSKPTQNDPTQQVKNQLKELKGEKKLRFILKRLATTKSEAEKKELRKELPAALDEGSGQNLRLSYNSATEGLEPAYFWILDFFQHTLGYKVNKTKEEFESSVGSGFFSDIGGKATRMQEQAMKMMGSINTVVRSIINLLYDLKEFDIRLAAYDEFRSNDPQKRKDGMLTLKQVWMDQVDVKKGVGSINGLAQQLQFVTLRDAYLQIDRPEDVDKKDVDLNERVKRILRQKLAEFHRWVETSERELRARYKIEKQYLRSQVASLKTYAEWTKPYLVAAQKLGMKGFDQFTIQNPNVVSAFNNLEMELELIGYKEEKVQSLIDDEELPENATTSDKYYRVVRVKIKFRSTPSGINSPQGYVFRQGGRFDMYFSSYGLAKKEYEALDQAEKDTSLDLIDDLVGVSLSALSDDLIKYLDDENTILKAGKKDREADEEAQKNYKKGPFKALLEGTKDIIKPVTEVFSFKQGTELFDDFVRNQAASSAASSAFTLYDVYKKAHGMLSV